MTKRYRLTARAQFHGEVRDPGYVFTLADGEIGPHKTVRSDAPGAQIADHIGGQSGMTDVPLYEEISDEHSAALDEAEAARLAAADAAAEETAAHDAKDDGEPLDDGKPRQIEDHSGDQS